MTDDVAKWRHSSEVSNKWRLPIYYFYDIFYQNDETFLCQGSGRNERPRSMSVMAQFYICLVHAKILLLLSKWLNFKMYNKYLAD